MASLAQFANGGFNFQNAESERNYSLLGQRKYIHARLNLNPIANPKPFPNPKITQRVRMESFYGLDYRKVGEIRFSADLVHCSRVLAKLVRSVPSNQKVLSLIAGYVVDI